MNNKPCPFCGTHDVVLGTVPHYPDKQEFYIYCTKCCVEGPHAPDIERAETNWNTRHE